VPVAEVIEDFQPGFASGEKNVAGGVSHLRMNNIGLDGNLVLDLVRTVPEKLAKPRHDLSPGDVLVCTTNSGALVGKCAYFDLKGRYAFSNHLTRLRPKRHVVDGRFLRWNLWLHWKRGMFDDKCKHWVNQSTLPKAALLEDKVVVPPLAEQRRIVAKLETLLGKVDASQQRLAKIPVLLKRFRHSVLAAACSGRLTADWREERTTDCTDDTDKKPSVKSAKSVFQSHVRDEAGSAEDLPDGWQDAVVGDVIDSLKYGTAQKCSYEKHGVPVLRIPNIADGIISHADLKYAELPGKEFQQLRLRPGDILLIRSNGSVSLVGKCALARKADCDFAYAGYLIRLRPDAGKVSPEFLKLALGSYDVRRQIEIPARSTSGVNNINSEEVRALRFSLPPLPEQQEIVRRVEGLFALADQIEARFTRARAQVDKLTPSLLARAFAGQLVPQDPTDEPAEKLLERIGCRNT
jgi:type I restriction enzyme S subunit